MTELLLNNSFFFMTLTLVAFSIGNFLHSRLKLAILNPLIIAGAVIICVLLILDIPNSAYQEGCQILNYLLTPATICLAISFYEQFQTMKKQMGAICIGIIAGTVCCLASIYVLSLCFGFDRMLTMSMLPKSITTAIGIAMSQEIGGVAAITTSAIALTGIFGYVTGPLMCRIFRIQHPIAQGVAYGTAAHVIGTTRASTFSELAGASGSLALTIAGFFTALLLSFLSQYL